MSKITVLCPQGRRQTVKVFPNTSILEVLEDACQKQGLKPEDYDINHYKKKLDLSLSVRFANLPNNAMLELIPRTFIRQESTVTVALQFESGERVTHDFPPASSLLDVLNTCLCSSEGPGNTSHAPDVEPVCIYLRQKFTGDQIKTTTLRSLGLTGGKASIRLIYRVPDSLVEQAHVSAPLSRPPPAAPVFTPYVPPKPMEDLDYGLQRAKQPRLEGSSFGEAIETDTSKDAAMLPVQSFSEAPEEPMQCDSVPESMDNMPTSDSTVNAPDSTVTMDSNSMDMAEEEKENRDPPPVKEIGEIIYLGPRNAVLFNLQEILEIKKDDFSDEFFELTVSDVRYLMDELKKARNDLENVPLITRSWREKQLLQELSRYKQSVIRIYFPDQLVLQGTFIAEETVQSIIEFVKSFLEDKSLDFYLYTAPPKTLLSANKTLLEAKLVPASVVYFGCNAVDTNFLRADIRSQVSDPRAAGQVAAECRKTYICSEALSREPCENLPPAMPTNVETPSNGNITPRRISTNDTKVPAWFKIGKK